METARILMGLIVAVFLADSLPVVRRSFIFRIATTLLFGSWAVIPVLVPWKAVLVLSVATFWSCSLRVWEKHSSQGVQSQAPMRRPFGLRSYSMRIIRRIGFEAKAALRRCKRWVKSPQRRSLLSGVSLALVSAVVVYLAIGPSKFSRLIHGAVESDKLTIVVLGLLSATFVSHEAVARLYALVDKDAPNTRTEIFAFNENYAFIGWLERALVFAFIASGQAAAAALAITAKSLARHQKLENERKFDERFIIGTVVSVLFAILWAVLVRVSLGLKPM